MKTPDLVSHVTAACLFLAASAAVHAADQPSAREILDLHVAALGGEKAIRAPLGIHYTGTFELQGLEGTFEMYRGDQQVVFSLDAPGIGNISQGFNGEIGWATGQAGPALLDGTQLEQMKYLAQPDNELRLPSSYQSIETLGPSEIDGETFNALELVTLGGDVITEYYHPDTGLRFASVSQQETLAGSQEVALIYTDYRRFGDLKVATRIEQRSGGQVLVRNVDAVQFGAIDEAVFELPDPIVELIGAKP